MLDFADQKYFQTHQHLIVAHFLANVAYALLLSASHGEVGGQFADLVQEVRQHLFAIYGEVHLWVELDAVDAEYLIVNGRHNAVCGPATDFQILAHSLHAIAVG